MLNNINFRSIIILILTFTAFSNLRVSAQYDSQFEKLTIKDGLSSNDVWDIIQDKYGLLWIATKDGINIYDGYNFKILKHSLEDSTSLPSNDCNTVFEDKNYEIWVGTKVGLAKYNRVNETFVNYQYTANNTEFANGVAKIYEDSQNNLWVSTNQGILLFNRTTNKFKKFDVMKIDNTVAQMVSNTISIFETKKGELFVGSIEYGLLKYDYSSQIFVQLNIVKGLNLLKGNHTYDIKEDKEGKLWLATFKGLMKVDLDNMLCKDITPFEKVLINQGGSRNAFYGVYKDRFDNIWAGTNSYGIYVYNSSTDEYKLIYANKNNNPTGPFYEDRFGIIWVATIQGIWKYDLDKKPFDLVLPANFSDEENTPIIFSFKESKKINRKLWLGSSLGLNLYNMDSKKIEVSSPLLNKINFPNKNSISTTLEENDNLWIGTITSGLFKFNLSTNRLENYLMRYYDYSTINNNRINSLLDTKNNDLWIATDFGINIINKKLNKISSIPSLMSRQYNQKLKQTVQNLIQKSKPITSIISVGDYADITKEFVLTKDDNVIISALGEGLLANNMVDYGWLESENGDTIWTCSDINSTYFAGGNGKNRTKIGMLKLKKGRYKLRYISDDSHSAQSFNAPPPEDTLSWGITMYSLPSDLYNSLEKIFIKDNSTDIFEWS